ncbi:hypothetical protein [Actinomyces vulturis]|uniref:hypothetical protein n=1 Tax=Actinomyces vulturis TaxID=1857645 RepID=UPI00083661F2|nr:hypothetical protein [Actinomyces vulturis]
MKKKAPTLENLLDGALTLPSGYISSRVKKLKDKNPHASIDELVEIASKTFIRDAGMSGGAVGASAAIPAVGTGTATALTIGESVAFIGLATVYVLTMAELHGITVDNKDKRRALVLSSLLGEEGAEAIQSQLGLSSLYWATQALPTMKNSTVKAVNRKLVKHARRKAGSKIGILAMGRLIPFGIGAAVGFTGARALARQVVEGAHAALGPISRNTVEVVLK